MKAIRLVVLLALAAGIRAPAGPPQDWESAFKIVNAALDPQTFQLTLTVTWMGQTNYPFRIQAHDGPPSDSAPWITSAPIFSTNHYYTYHDDLSGSLTTNGKTYRGSVGEGVLTINEEFVPYPFMTNPVVSIKQASSGSNTLVVEYADGLYSNSVPMPLPPGTSRAYFRLWSPDVCPSNAVLLVNTSMNASIWSPIPSSPSVTPLSAKPGRE
ncbi:MAG: hypothetical protein K8T26_20130 [Lentisphaerae bacterium]|nr:hypothetical protein [Lentisphaerota bacterium]